MTLDEIDSDIKTMQYLYAWLLEDYVYLIKHKKTPKKKGRSIWVDLYKKARSESTHILEAHSEEEIRELYGEYKILRFAIDREFGFTDSEITSRDKERFDFIQKNF